MKWNKISDIKPPHKVLLVACDTYDCGWVIDTCWWSGEDKCWYGTSGVGASGTHLPYTHWALLPKPPEDELEFNEDVEKVTENLVQEEHRDGSISISVESKKWFQFWK